MTLDHHMFLSTQIVAQLAAAGYPLSDGPTPTSEEQDMWSVIAAFCQHPSGDRRRLQRHY